VVPEQVIAEVSNPTQSAHLRRAIANGELAEVTLTDISELGLYAELLKIFGSGEAACLALAEIRGWHLASDERKLFLREATKRIGRARIINTAGIFVKAIRLGLLTVDEADQDKKLLEQHRFIMKFSSFRDVL
jgi:predicted nucleic acid-binding protein